MQKSVLYGIIAALAIAAGAGIAFGAMSMDAAEPTVPEQQASNEVRSIKHLGGETEITGTPERIVVLDSELAENMLLLGAGDSIVGASLWKTFDSSFEEEMQKLGLSVPSHIVDVGDYWQPNLESIAELEPDLIIITDVWNEPIYDDLNKIAPTLMFATYPSEEDNDLSLEEMEQTIMALADALNRHEEGVAALDRFHAKLDEASSKIESAGLKDQKFVVAEVWVFEDSPEMYLYTQNSVASQVLEKIGLQNAIPAEENTAWGLMTGGPEGLASIAIDNPDMHFFFGHYDTVDEVNYYNVRDMVRNDPVWENMEFNKKDHAHELGAEFKPRPTPRHMEALVDKVVQALTGEVKVIKHAMGETEIEGTPERVVALQWNYVEDLLALGVQPAGVADIATMERFVDLGGLALSEDVVDVGLRYEPNLEVIAQLEPDLIIGDYSGNGKSYEQLSAIAPTILFDPYPAQDDGIGRMEEMKQTFMTIADIVGRHDQGVAVLDRMNQKLDEAKSAVEASDAAGKPFVLVMTGSYKDDYTKFRIWTQDARAAEIIEKMGMENAWNADYSQYGYSEIGLEHLTTVQDANFFYVAGGGHDPFETALYTDNPVWSDLRFVQEGRVYPLGGETWLYGGPVSAEILADKVVDAITKQ